jgi:hypothetical protein
MARGAFVQCRRRSLTAASAQSISDFAIAIGARYKWCPSLVADQFGYSITTRSPSFYSMATTESIISFLSRANEMSDADKPTLRPANDNPWYCLATLHGEQSVIDDELASKNRIAWNCWIATALSDEERASLVRNGFPNLNLHRSAPKRRLRYVAPTLLGQAAAKKNCHPNRLSLLTTLSRNLITFVTFAGFLFARNADFSSATFSGSNFSSATFSGDADFSSATFFYATFVEIAASIAASPATSFRQTAFRSFSRATRQLGSLGNRQHFGFVADPINATFSALQLFKREG